MTTAASVHAPVLLNEVVSGLAVRDGGLYVDGTFGAGGYTAAILAAANCKVWAIDRDPDAIARGARTRACSRPDGPVREIRRGAPVPGASGVSIRSNLGAIARSRALRLMCAFASRIPIAR